MTYPTPDWTVLKLVNITNSLKTLIEDDPRINPDNGDEAFCPEASEDLRQARRLIAAAAKQLNYRRIQPGVIDLDEVGK